MIGLNPIGVVKNGSEKLSTPEDVRCRESTIVVDEKYEDGLYRIEENEYLQVIFHFHRSPDYALKCPTSSGTVKGVFASRSPKRPSPIGVTTVRLVERDGRQLKVMGLDAVDGTPVLDLKPYAAAMDAAEQSRVERDYDRRNPRRNIFRKIRKGELEEVLSGAGAIHGHFCPGLSMGVMAGAYAVSEMNKMSDGMERLLAVVETNNCFSDGIQYTTGCTFGNNCLIYRDFGKTAATLATRDGAGVRVSVRPDFRGRRDEALPEFRDLFDKVVRKRRGGEKDQVKYQKLARDAAFAMLKIAFAELFKAERVTAAIPPYAPVHESIVCDKCGESIMSSRIVESGAEKLCIPCAGKAYCQISGEGITSCSPSGQL